MMRTASRTRACSILPTTAWIRVPERSSSGIFPNQEKILFPGLFARVRIWLGEPAPALVVPNTALANDQVGNYLLVVNAQNIAERRNVAMLGARVGAMCAITEGLNENDRVIIGGQSACVPARP